MTDDLVAQMVARISTGQKLLPWPELTQDLAYLAATLDRARETLGWPPAPEAVEPIESCHGRDCGKPGCASCDMVADFYARLDGDGREPLYDVTVICGDSTGPNGVGGPCVHGPGHPHRDGIGGQWSQTRVAIDLNVRVRGQLTVTGVEDASAPVEVGQSVLAVEQESGLSAPGIITGIDHVRRLVYLAVAWKELRDVPR